MKPLVTEQDAIRVSKRIESQWIGRGFLVNRLEGWMAAWVNAKHAVAFGSGTMALMMAIKHLRPQTVSRPHDSCEALNRAIILAGAVPVNYSGDVSISIYPKRGGDIEDFAKHLPKKGEVQLQGKYGVFSFGALKDVTGGIGGCLVSNDPIDPKGWEWASPLSDINAALILSQLSRYDGHATQRLVADGKIWDVR